MQNPESRYPTAAPGLPGNGTLHGITGGNVLSLLLSRTSQQGKCSRTSQRLVILAILLAAFLEESRVAE